MNVFGKAAAIIAGILIGGGIGFYWRETYWLDFNREKKNELEVKLKELTVSRKQKEDSVHNR